MKTKTGVSWKIEKPFIGFEPMTYAYFLGNKQRIELRESRCTLAHPFSCSFKERDSTA
jgi:hypothetical protein